MKINVVVPSGNESLTPYRTKDSLHATSKLVDQLYRRTVYWIVGAGIAEFVAIILALRWFGY